MRDVVIAGAGIAGLTAALAFARHGFSVRVHERSAVLDEVGAGLQLSPNVTRLLDELGVLDRLADSAVQPEAVVLRQASNLAEVTRVPLGAAARRRWNAPYLVIHRADLQRALLQTVAAQPAISLTLGSAVVKAQPRQGGIETTAERNGISGRDHAELFVVADGVWSKNRSSVRSDAASRFSGSLAWRTTILSDSEAGKVFTDFARLDCVTAFMHVGFHMIAYPLRKGSVVNLAAFTPGTAIAESWDGDADQTTLETAMRGAAAPLARLVALAGPWRIWPLHVVDGSLPWMRHDGIALIGDAAHATTPFAAQGGAMAIEDAYTLADAVARGGVSALPVWEGERRQRVAKVVRRGAINKFAWHASGPVALARNLFLKTRPAEKLAADLDWLYGWTPPRWDRAAS